MKIDHINIVVTNIADSIAFFEMLGFVVKDRSVLEGEWISEVVGLPDVRAEYAKMNIDSGETSLELIQYFSPEGSKDPDLEKPNQIGFRHMAFQVENIEAIVEQLQNNNVEFMSEIREYPKTGKKLVYFKGPDGIVLELAEYGVKT